MSTVANTIIRQLSTATIHGMLGAKTVLTEPRAISFKFKGSRKFNHLRIELDPSDTYTVTFKKLGGFMKAEVKDEASFSGVYVDMLHDLIEEQTGLATRMPTIHGL